MRVKLNDIPEEGLTLTEPFDPEGLNLQTPELKFVAPLKITARFQKERDAVVASVRAAGNVVLVCGRCLKLYEKPYDGLFDLGYSIKDMVFLDVTEDIRQEILLSYPVEYVCKEGCLGLCAHCGKNLNEGVCGCPR